MSQFQFIIAQNDIASGDPSSNVTVVADRGLARQSVQRVLTAKFGDGYEQRVLDGTNTKLDVFTISFNNRTAADINRIAAFFDVKAGKSFTFTATDHSGDTAIKVVCESYNITYITDSFHNLNCTLRRVYEP
jgi:phage-related protein